MHLFVCFTDGLFAKADEESKFFENLRMKCGAETTRTDGCTDNAQTVIITAFDTPPADERFPVSGPRSALGRIAHAAQDFLGEKVTKLTVRDASGHHPMYVISFGQADAA